MSEKSITRQQERPVRRAKTSRRKPADLAGTCSGGKLVVSSAGEAYDARDRGPNRKYRLKGTVPYPPVLPGKLPAGSGEWKCLRRSVSRLLDTNASMVRTITPAIADKERKNG